MNQLLGKIIADNCGCFVDQIGVAPHLFDDRIVIDINYIH